MSEKFEQVAREALSEMFDFLAYKVRNGAMTLEEMDSVMRLFSECSSPKATVRELSRFYGQTEDNIRHIIHRNMMPKPVRKVYYDFLSFCRFVPKRWHIRRTGTKD
ncbi:MAG: hypothetical protein J5658_03705 [Prevotella sp.]|nr:hypothetical protein [Prevotella sp.]